MTSARWQIIHTLFHAVLERPAAERQSFLNAACVGDRSLQLEVEGLLLAHDRPNSFIDSPAYEILDDIFVERTDFVGQVLGRYKVLAQLEAGGMGEVYLAFDTSLQKKVALKILPLHFSKDESRVRRFEQEARLASAPDHPNVCVIHEIGKTDDGRHFIVMEYIDGLTLRERINQGIDFRNALDIGIQIAAALDAAHNLGIVHRDIKPENVMVRKDGYVKVLDFGIAKLNEDLLPWPENDDEPRVNKVQTEHGTRIGTVRYMSPEQLGEMPGDDLPIDGRADIWSLGVVLYEMTAGVTPFEDLQNDDLVELIASKQPVPLKFPDEMPQEFREIVAKAVNKKRQERYQRAQQIVTELGELRRQIDISARHTGGAALNARPAKPKSVTARTAEYVLGEITAHRTATIFVGLATLVVVAWLVTNALLSGRLTNPLASRPSSVSLSLPIKMVPFTNSGTSVCAAISPDGRFIAHAEEKDGKQELLVTSVDTHVHTVVVPAGDFQYKGITFSADGESLYFVTIDDNETGTLYQIVPSRGQPAKIKAGVDSPIAFSPAGDRFAFVRIMRPATEYSLVIAKSDGSDERIVAGRKNGERLSVDGPAWSHDGKRVICGAGSWDNGYHMRLISVDVDTGLEEQLGKQRWFSILQVASLAEDSVIVNAAEATMSPYQLWRISYPDGEASRVTNDIDDYQGVSLSTQGRSLVSIRTREVSQIWLATGKAFTETKPVLSKVGLSNGLSWGTNQSIVFSSLAGDNLNISTIHPDGSGQRQLTVNGGDNYAPAICSDGRHLVFSSNRTGGFNIWRMNAEDGSDLQQLTFSDGNFYPACSPDNQWVFFENQLGRKITLWKVPLAGGEASLVIDQYSRMPAISPDNQFLACRYYLQNGSLGIAIVSIHGGSPIKLISIPVMRWQKVEWMSNGELSYVRNINGVSNVWSYDLVKETSKQLTDFKTERIFSYSWSPDFTQLACERGSNLSDVTLITQ